MKTTRVIYLLNITLIIFNLILILTPFYALLFLMILGAFQILFTIIIGFHFKEMSPAIKTNYLIYIFLVASVLYTFFLVNKGFLDSGQQLITLCFVTSICLALHNLFITYKVQK
ncbi:MAG: hypothetical protein CMC76_00020 [Flavobacteriaceae bacterium]|nr:hypothetical protein [Flavobacteriaceae bacterium]